MKGLIKKWFYDKTLLLKGFWYEKQNADFRYI